MTRSIGGFPAGDESPTVPLQQVKARRPARWLLAAVLGIVALVGLVGSAFAFKLGPLSSGTAATHSTQAASNASDPSTVAALFDTSLDDGTSAPPTAAPDDTALAALKTPKSCAGHYYQTMSNQVIVVCKREQWLFVYDHGKLVFNAPVETARPGLVTPTGVTRISYKGRNLTFTSPWPKGSPYYYYPTHINYAMEFHAGGFFLHDAWWHYEFGPGSNVPHKLPNGTWETGSHGCVGMKIAAAKWLYNWSHVGTWVVVSNQ